MAETVKATQILWVQGIQRIQDLEARVLELEAALRQIAEKPEGVYSRDPVKYRDNVIAWCQEVARAALAQPGAGEQEATP